MLRRLRSTTIVIVTAIVGGFVVIINIVDCMIHTRYGFRYWRGLKGRIAMAMYG